MLVAIILLAGMLASSVTGSIKLMIAGLAIAIILNTAELKWLHSHMHEGKSDGQ